MTTEEQFECWWGTYPRKIAKANARKAFAKAIKKLGLNKREGYNLDCSAFCPPGRQMSLI